MNLFKSLFAKFPSFLFSPLTSHLSIPRLPSGWSRQGTGGQVNSQRGLAPLAIIIVVALIAAAVPTTVILVQQEQDNRQEAQIQLSSNLKNAGALCGDPSDCASNRCELGKGFNKICIGNNNDECHANDHCSSNICINDVCKEFKNTYHQFCEEDADCVGNNCLESQKWCISKTPDYEHCNLNSDCANPSFTCAKNICLPKSSSGQVCDAGEGSADCEEGLVCNGGICVSPSDSKSGVSKPRCNEYELTNQSGQYYGECKAKCDSSINESPLLSHTCDYTDISSVCCKVKVLSDAKKPTPISTPTTVPPGGGGDTAPTPIIIAPTKGGWCADGNRQNARPYPTDTKCNINNSPYNKQYDAFCHETFGSPSDFYYECPTASTPTVPGYCANATATSNPISINNPTCGLANTSYDSNYDAYCAENYGKKDSQSKYFYRCIASTAPPTSTPTVTTTPTTTPTSQPPQNPGAPVQQDTAVSCLVENPQALTFTKNGLSESLQDRSCTDAKVANSSSRCCKSTSQCINKFGDGFTCRVLQNDRGGPFGNCSTLALCNN